jgi:peptide deformylase
MFSIMYYRGGVGLAAPQVGWNASLFIANPHGRAYHNTHGQVFINPSIVGLGDTVIEKEGCLSFPGIFADVERNERVNIRYSTMAKDGVEEEYSGFMARIIQHEYDHLNGILFIDRLTEEAKKLLKPKLDSHRERVRRIRKKRNKRQREAEARKKNRAEKRRKQRRKRKGKSK